MKSTIKKVMFYILMLLLIAITLELVFLSLLLKNPAQIGFIIQTIAKTALVKDNPLILSTSLVNAKNNNLCLTAKTEIQYQGVVNKIDFLNNNEALRIELKDASNQSSKEITLSMSVRSLSMKDGETEMDIRKIKIGDIIKVSFFYDYKQSSTKTLIEQFSNYKLL